MRRALHIIGWVIVGLVSLQIMAYILLQIPAVQTWTAHKIVKSLTKDIHGKVNVDKVYIVFFNKVLAKNFSIVSTDRTPLLDSLKKNFHQSDTLVAANDVVVTFKLSGLLTKNISIRSIKVEGGVFNLQDETENTNNLDRIFPSTGKTSTSNPSFKLKSLTVKDFRFNLNSPYRWDFKSKRPDVADFADLQLKGINVKAKNIKYKNSTLDANILNISGTDKSGFGINYFTGKVTVGPKLTMIKNVRAGLGRGKSKLIADYFSMGYSNAHTFKYFTDSVVLGARFRQSFLDFKTIGSIAPAMVGSSLAMYLSGEVRGTVRHLRSNKLIVSSKSGQTFLSIGNVRVDGLPDAGNTVISGDVNSCTTTGSDLAEVIASIDNSQKIAFLQNLTPFTKYNFSGNVSGKFDNLFAQGELSSAIGVIWLSTRIKRGEAAGGGTQVEGYVDSQNFDLGAMTGNRLLGSVTAKAVMKVNTGGKGGVSVAMDSVKVNKLVYKGYAYSNIFAKGKYQNESFDGKVICHDPNLDMLFQGFISLKPNTTRKYNFYANIPYADLAAIHLDKRDSISVLSTSLQADFTQSPKNDVFGYLNVDNASYTNSSGDYEIGPVKAISKFEADKYVIDFTSNFAKGEYEGTGKVTDFIGKIKSLIIYKNFSNLLGYKSDRYLREHGYSTTGEKGSDYNLILQTFNTQGIFALVAPGLYIQDSTYLRMRVTPEDHYRLIVRSGRVAYKQDYLRKVRVYVTDQDSLMYARLFSQDARVQGFKVDSAMIVSTGRNNLMDVSVRFRNDSTGTNNTHMNTLVSFLKDTVLMVNGRNRRLMSPVNFAIKPSDVSLKGEKWNFTPASVLYSDSLIVVNNLQINNKRQNFTANGTLSKQIPDSLGIKLNNFDIGFVDLFLEKPFNLHGYFSGKANFSLNKNTNKMFAEIRGDSVSVYGAPVGDMLLLGKWSEPEKRYNILLKTDLEGTSKLAVDGYYKPDSSYVDMHSTLNDLSLTYFEPFLSSVATKTSGYINGNIRLYGPINKLVLTGTDCFFKDFHFVLDYTKVPYTINGPLVINENGVFLKNDQLKDQYGNTGTISGNVTYKNFKNLKLNTRIALDNLQCLNTKEKDNPDFYGDGFASGTVNISGTPEKILLDVNARTEPNTLVHIPVSGSSSATKTNILTFVKEKKYFKIDPYDTLQLSAPKEVSAPTEIVVKLQLNVSPEANVWLEVNKSTGDIIKANGTGQIGIEVDPKKDVFDLTGNYSIEHGSYHFVLLGIAARDFEIQPGGNITFNGNVEDTDLDLTALYKTKASINALISDTSSVSSMRNVTCQLGLSGKLSDPQMKFHIDIPDLDPTTKVKVSSALNSDDKVQKQFASLIVSGGFVPDEQSGISSNATVLYSNASEMLSGQLNNIFMQLGIPLDLGLNYHPGDKGSTDVFDVAVSTQLFNNRVIINGNIGNDPYTGNNGRDVIGNIDVEVKLDKNGKLRMNFFSHATDRYSNYLDESQRTGLGIAYQQDFNSFGELFRKKTPEQKAFDKKIKAEDKAKRAADRAKRIEARKAKAAAREAEKRAAKTVEK
jgi:hypothetical protein